MSGFTKATREQAKLRLAIQGPAGSGKTRSALELARHFGRTALVDTEHKSASLYAGVNGIEFDVMEITENYHPDRVGKAIQEAHAGGYDIIIIDSGTHFWNAEGGFLDLVEQEVAKVRARGGKPDTFAAWKIVDPVYRRFVQSILTAPIHVIVTLRAKTEYEKTDTADGRKGQVRKIGMAPEMRDKFQYEMGIEGMLDMDHGLTIGKTRCDAVDGKYFPKPGKELADILKTWLSEGVPAKVAVVKTSAELAAEHIALLEEASTEEAVGTIVADVVGPAWPDGVNVVERSSVAKAVKAAYKRVRSSQES